MPGEMKPITLAAGIKAVCDPSAEGAAAALRGLEMDSIPLHEARDEPLVMVSAEVDAPVIWGALAPPFAGLLEPTPDGQLPYAADVAEAVAQDGIGLSLSTASAFHAMPSEQVAAALSSRFLLTEKQEWAIDLAIQEAVGNSLIHGNLGIESDMREKFIRLKAFNALLTARLSDPKLARRRLLLTAIPDGGVLKITVTDEGDGFDPDTYLCRSALASDKRGRGLGLMRWLSRSLVFDECGRRVTMTFPRVEE